VRRSSWPEQASRQRWPTTAMPAHRNRAIEAGEGAGPGRNHQQFTTERYCGEPQVRGQPRR
jgi:hypothetical protein